MTTTSPPTSPHPFPDARPRAPTVLSMSSHRSRRSSTSAHKLELIETAKEKRRLNTKADPSKALNEATPAEQAQEESTVEDLRRMVHKDNDGNVITDPDRSNPTRHRLERPLDTIRAFEAAAEGTTVRRSSFNNRPPSQVAWNGDANRRASYFSNGGYSPQRPRPSPGGGYYRNSSYGFGPQSSLEEAPGSAHMHGRNGRQHSNPYPPAQNGHHNGYPSGDSPISAHSYQQSYETMTSGSDEYSKSTNPSSQNSSFDQLHQLRKPEDHMAENAYANEVRFNGVPPHKPLSPSPYGMNNGHYGQDVASPPGMQPREYVPNNPRQPIKLDGPSSGPDFAAAPAPATTTTTSKKQSWIKRRFSRRDS